MGRRKYSNTAVVTTLNGAITSGATSMTVTSKTGWPTSFPFSATLEPNTANQEIVDVTANPSGNQYTIVRGRDGSTGVAHSTGVTVAHWVTGRDHSELRERAWAWLTSDTSVATTGTTLGLTASQESIDDGWTVVSSQFTPPAGLTGLWVAEAVARQNTDASAPRGGLIMVQAVDGAVITNLCAGAASTNTAQETTPAAKSLPFDITGIDHFLLKGSTTGAARTFFADSWNGLSTTVTTPATWMMLTRVR